MKITSFIILFFLGFCIQAQHNYDSIKGNVKSVREKLIFLNDSIQNRKFFSTEGDYGHHGFTSPEFTISRFKEWWYQTYWVHYINCERKYNEKGQLISESWFDKKDSLIRKYNYQYDKSGNNNQIINYGNHSDEDIIITNSFYNQQNQLQSMVRVFYDSPEQYYYVVNQYDEGKQLIQRQHFDEYGESHGMKYEYDLKGRKIKDIQHLPYIWKKEGNTIISVRDKTGTDRLYREYFYDNNSNLIQEKQYVEDYNDPNKYALSSTIIYNYDFLNREIKRCYLDVHYPVDNCILYKYDKNNLLVSEYRTHSGQRQKYKYKNGRLSDLIFEEYIEEKFFKTEVNFDYEFDSHGNWIKQTKIVNKIPLYIRFRNIEYFNHNP